VLEKTWKSDQNHGRELMPAVIEILAEAGIEPQAVTHLAVALGPGGFSAVRVGISAVLGLSAPNDLPVAGIPTHSVEAERYLADASKSAPLFSVIPAGRQELSWAMFDGSSDGPAETGLCSLDQLVTAMPANARVCGEAAEALVGKVPPEMIAGSQPPTRKPASLIRLAASRFEAHGPTPPASLRPIYARPPSITKPNPVK
jgi:tRNA threonylcarbamoyl adenosine modification protein YeaZ